MNSKKYYQFDPNQNYYNLVIKPKEQVDSDLDKKAVIDRIYQIAKRLKELTDEDKNQWSMLQKCKIKQLYARYKATKAEKNQNQVSKSESKLLRESMAVFVLASSSEGIEYEVQQIQTMIKEIYSDLHGHKIVDSFVKAGYLTDELQILFYQEEPSFFRKYMCCFRAKR